MVGMRMRDEDINPSNLFLVVKPVFLDSKQLGDSKARRQACGEPKAADAKSRASLNHQNSSSASSQDFHDFQPLGNLQLRSFCRHWRRRRRNWHQRSSRPSQNPVSRIIKRLTPQATFGKKSHHHNFRIGRKVGPQTHFKGAQKGIGLQWNGS